MMIPDTGKRCKVIGLKMVQKLGLQVCPLKERVRLLNASGMEMRVNRFCLMYIENGKGDWV